MVRLTGPAYLAAGPFIMAYCLSVFLLETQKEPKRSPLLPIAREARPRGYSPLGTPKLRSRSKKAKPCRSAARFLTLFCFSPSGPSGAKTGRRGRRPLRINFMFAIKGKGPRRGQAPPYSTILYGAFRPRRGQSGEERKSVKKNAALLCFLAFLLLDHNFGVFRGEQPLRRGCGVAQRSKPQWGFEPHERAGFAGWRPSFWPPSAPLRERYVVCLTVVGAAVQHAVFGQGVVTEFDGRFVTVEFSGMRVKKLDAALVAEKHLLWDL